MHASDPIGGTSGVLGTHGILNQVGMIAGEHPGVYGPNVDIISTELFVVESDGDVHSIFQNLASALFDPAQIGGHLAFDTSA